MSDLDKINSIFNAKIDTVKSNEDLQNIKTEFFGKNGQITKQFKNLGSLDPEKRKEFASNLNKIKDDLTKNSSSKIKLDYKHEPDLIAGLIIQIGSTMIDTSIKARLQKIQNKMIGA